MCFLNAWEADLCGVTMRLVQQGRCSCIPHFEAREGAVALWDALRARKNLYRHIRERVLDPAPAPKTEESASSRCVLGEVK